MTEFLTSFLEASVRTATPLALAAFGELIVERAGIINIGLEGAIISGAFAALLGASVAGTPAGYVGGALAGITIAALFAFFVVRLHADQIIAGMAITLLGLGLTSTCYHTLYPESGAALTIPTSNAARVPIMAMIPVIGSAFFAQPLITYSAYLSAPLLWLWLYRTRGGLALRAVGERPEAAGAAGIRTSHVQTTAIVFGGAMGGLSGATLVLSQAGTFAEGMSAGRGFIAIAIVVLGRWHPFGVAVAALFFGVASATQFLSQAMGWALPYQLFLALPYILTLLALTQVRLGTRAPAALGR